MHFGEPLEDERLLALLRPGGGIDTVITADVYGAGEADRAAGPRARGPRPRQLLPGRRDRPRLLRGRARRARRASRASPTRRCAARARLRAPTCGWPPSAASSAAAPTRFDLLLLHNPDRTGYSSAAVWEGMRGAARGRASRDALGVAPGPANGFTLDLIDCLERFGEQIDWAMIILNPLEPWPGELVLGAAAERERGRDHARRRLRRRVPRRRAPRPRASPSATTAASARRAGCRRAREKLELMRPYAERHGLTMLQLACAWNLAPARRCAAWRRR